MALLRRLFVAALVALILSAVIPLDSGLGSRNRDASVSSGASSTRSTARVRAADRRILKPTRPQVPLSPNTTVLAFPAPPVMARAAYVVDLESGKVLYEKNQDARLPMASTTKITTAVLALQRARLSDMVVASNNAATVGESTMSLVKGERLSVRDLLYGLLLNSGNDAAVALAEHVGGTQARFVAMMNDLANHLHMTNTHYATPHGLDAPNHYTSARDLATITMYALRDPTFRRVVATTEYHIPPTKRNHEHWLGNINKALYWYPGADGVKPGDTDAAGLCQVVTARRNGRHILAVVLNTPNLVTDIRNLLNMGSRDFNWVPSIFAADQPASLLAGGSGSSSWVYYYGAGHYIRGLFLAYFRTHGGLQALGYPRTEQIVDSGQTVQYFQGGELVYDPSQHSVYPQPLGESLAKTVWPRAITRATQGVARNLKDLYRSLGGAGVLGPPLTREFHDAGVPVQFFQYGELAVPNGVPAVVPIGDAALRLRGWLPTVGIGDSFPPTLAPALEARYVRPKPRPHPTPLVFKSHRVNRSTRISTK